MGRAAVALYRQADDHARAIADSAVRFDGAAISLDQGFGDRQPQTRAAVLTRG